MIKDGSTKHNLGFGLPIWAGPEVDEGAPEPGASNAIQRMLGGKPVLTFFATATASLVSMHLAGKVAREGGVRLAARAQDLARQEGQIGRTVTRGIGSFRRIQRELDALEGISRQYVDPRNPNILVKRADDGSGWVRDTTLQTDGYFVRRHNPSAPDWQIRDEIQQRLVRQARRLPYELPGFYAADKLLLDPILGNDSNSGPNWSNPFDVIGDFAYESLKNVALNVIPFEVGLGAGKGSLNKMLSHVADNPTNAPGLASLKTGLELVGADVTNLANRAIRFSNQSMGAFSQLVKDASENGMSLSQFYKAHGSAAIQKRPPIGNSNVARRTHTQNVESLLGQDFRRAALDTMPGPFKGMGTALSMYKQNFKSIGETFDDWQDVISGRVSLDTLAKRSNGDVRVQKVKAFMNKGGGTYLEQFAKSSHALGQSGPTLPDGKVNPDWRKGEFYKLRSQDTYKATLIDALSQNTGLTPEQAAKFIRLSDQVSPYPGGRALYRPGENLIERIQFSGKVHTDSIDEWWRVISRGATKHGLPFDKNHITLESFRESVRRADSTFSGQAFQEFLSRDIAAQWNQLHGNVLPKFVGQSFSASRAQYDDFSNAALGSVDTRNYLVRRTAQSLGINVTDTTGNGIPVNSLKDQIRNFGLNPDNPYQLRGVLVQRKDIAAPWSTKRGNIFGIRAMSLDEALENGYFAGNNDAIQKEISYLVNHKTFQNSVGRGGNLHNNITETRRAAKLGRVFVNSSGNVIDLGRVQRSVVGALDTFASDYQIPLLHFNPLQLGFYKKYQQMRNAASINIISKHSIQPGSVLGEDAAFFTLVKTNANKSKGKVVAINGTDSTGVTSRVLSGYYRPTLTNTNSIGGRYSRLFMGETGIPSSSVQALSDEAIADEFGIDPTNTKRLRRRRRVNRLKQIFNVSHEQKDSLIFGHQSVINRMRSARKGSLLNPNRMAQAISDPGFVAGSLNAKSSVGFENLVDHVRNYSFSARTLRKLSERQGPLSDALESVLGGRKIFDIPDSQLPDVVRQVLDTDIKLNFKNITDDTVRTQARRSQNNLRALLGQGQRQNDFWTLPAPDAARSAGIGSRLDQLRNEFADYVVGTSNIRSSGVQFQDIVRRVLGDLDDMFAKGTISSVERTEARAAVLSLQVEHARNKTYAIGSDYTFLSHNRETLAQLLNPNSGYSQVRELMGEVGSFKSQDAGRVKRLFRKATAADPYEVMDEVNPFGSGILLEPTFGTAFSNNPRKALMGAAGLSWAPEAYSGAAIPATHLVMRLNKYFETFGVGLDANKFRSPVDLFARGMVGQRVLPLYAVGATALSADATLGGLLNDRDQEGNRVYSPFVLGKGADVVARGQIALAGAIPGGQTAEEKREELYEGQVPIRKGRFWALGNTPWKGGRIDYFRPSWYQRFKSGASYTPEMNQTPMERLLFGYDFSPLRPLDPYRFERENAQTRPYPVSGDYFTGPFGPVTPALNATVGRILKPRRQMVSDQDLQYLMQQYAPVGDSGAYLSQTPIMGNPMRDMNAGYANAGIGTGSANVFYPAMGFANPRGRASAEVRGRASQMAAMYSEAAQTPGSYVDVYSSLVPYGVPNVNGGMSSRVISSQPLTSYGSFENQSRRLGYMSQEMAGIYGFGFSSIRDRLGLGTTDLTSERPMLQPASMGYSSARSFWNLNLGGMGDLPLPIEGQFANLEISEIIRRFVPREPSGAEYINPLPNQMGREYPWLPGVDYPLAPLKTGDPYSRIHDAEIRLPGTGYRRTNQVFGSVDNMSIANIHQILGDVAPWSQQYRAADRLANNANVSDMERALINRTRYQVEAKRIENEFTPYEYKYQSPLEAGQHPFRFTMGRFGEWLAHRDTYFNRKFLPVHTAAEDWERDSVYGATYPQWQTPIKSFLDPMINRATQRDPFTATLGLGAVGSLFGVTGKAKLTASVIGGAVGFGASTYGHAYEAVTGNRYLPADRRKELALEEYIDILSYVKSLRNAAAAREMGDSQAASYFMGQSQRTMYGANLNSTPEQLAMAIPSRKREHFKAMLYAPEQEREQILSTAGRLERRFYQAAWGMEVEQLPDLNQYFENRELPPLNSQVWDPNIDMDTIKIKVGQSLGLDMAQMGYYPQQVKEANLINPVYPNMFQGTNSSTLSQLQRLIFQNGYGNVQSIQTPFPGTRVELNAGIYG